MIQTKTYTSYNPFFLWPFLIWFFAGGILLLFTDKGTVFRWVNNFYTDMSDMFFETVTYFGEGTIIIPVLILIMIFPQFRNWRYIIAAIIANVGTLIISQAIKSIVNAPRPLNYFQDAPWIHIADTWEKHYHRSFPSGHTAGAFAFFCFLSLLLGEKYRAWGFVFFITAFLVGYSRLYLAVHFFADVYVGSVLGVALSMVTIGLVYKPSFRYPTLIKN